MRISEIKEKIKDIDEGLAEFSESEKKQFGAELLQKKSELQAELKRIESAEKKTSTLEKTLEKAKQTIASKSASTTKKNTAKKQVEKVKKEITKTKQEKAKVNTKTNTVISNAKALLDKLKATKEQKEFNKGRSKDEIENDARVKALKAGKRVSKSGHSNQYGVSEGGNVYYENRTNRSDVSTKRKPYLEDGGEIDFYEDLRVYVQGSGSIYQGSSMKDALEVANDYLEKRPNSEITIIDEKYGDEYDINGNILEYKKGGKLSSTESERLDYLQSKEDTDSLTQAENEEYEMLVEKYRCTKDYKGYAKGGECEITRADYLLHLREYDKLGAFLEDAYEEKNEEKIDELKGKMNELESKINRYERSYAKGGKLSNKGAYLNAPQGENYTRYEDSKESNRAKPAGWRYTNAGAKRLKLKAPNQLVSKDHLQKYRGKYFTDSKGVKHRYIYIERRADKSDVKRGFPFLERGGSLNMRRFTKNDFNRLRDGDFYSTWSGDGNWDIKEENTDKIIGIFNEDKETIKAVGSKKVDNPLVKWLQQNSYVSSEEYYILEKGGSIPNNYKGKTAEQVWNEWSVEQRLHFCDDHNLMDNVSESTLRKNANELKEENWGKEFGNSTSWSWIKNALQTHIMQGQYEKGGEISEMENYQVVKDYKNGLISNHKLWQILSGNNTHYKGEYLSSKEKSNIYSYLGFKGFSGYPLEDKKGQLHYEDGGEIETNESALKVYVKPTKKEGIALFKQGEAVCVCHNDNTYEWHDEKDLLKMEDGEILSEIVEDLLEGTNINVFGYQTQNFDVSENAAKYFNEAITKIEELGSENAKECLVKAAEHLDSILHKVKVKEESEYDLVEELKVKSIIADVQLFAYNNYRCGIVIPIDLLSNICSEILELDVDSKMVFEKGGTIDPLEKELHRLLRELNSSRLSKYREGDNSEEEIERKRERAEKLKRFNEVLAELKAKKNKYEQGGEIDFKEDNQYMLEIKAKELNHHINELSETLKENKDVPAWVLTKVQRAATDLSDITHYMEGKDVEGYEEGGEMKHNYFVYDESSLGVLYNDDRGIEKFESVAVKSDVLPYRKSGDIISINENNKHKLRMASENDFEIFNVAYEKGGEMYAKGGVIKEIDLPNSNLYLYGFGRDANGNSTIKVSIGANRPFSIQINNPDFYKKTYGKRGYKLNELTEEDILGIEQELVSYIKENGNKEQKAKIKTYSSFEKGGIVDRIISLYEEDTDSKGEFFRLKAQALFSEEKLDKYKERAKKETMEFIDKGQYMKVVNVYVHPKNAREPYLDKYKVSWVDENEQGGEMKWGGRTTFNEKVAAITESLNGRKVKPKYQKDYGKTYDKKEARTAAQKIVGKLMTAENRKKKAAAKK